MRKFTRKPWLWSLLAAWLIGSVIVFWVLPRVLIRLEQQSNGAKIVIEPVVSRTSFGASLGSIYAHVAGFNDPVTGMPTNAALFPRAVDPTTQPGTTSFGNFSATGPLSAACAPFVPGGG